MTTLSPFIRHRLLQVTADHWKLTLRQPASRPDIRALQRVAGAPRRPVPPVSRWAVQFAV